jgi:hypothetical protein
VTAAPAEPPPPSRAGDADGRIAALEERVEALEAALEKLQRELGG